ncbi:MAG TPA: cell division protein FtsH, partial [Terrimesophilobacter sp.]|nr:cell division protein FtsH [Terrimesophilobacter sp.]
MDFKRFLRGPVLYVAIATLIVIVGFSFLKSQRVESAQIHDGEQRVDLVLNQAGAQGKNVQFYYAWHRGEEVVNTVTNANLTSFDDKVTNPNWFT